MRLKTELQKFFNCLVQGSLLPDFNSVAAVFGCLGGHTLKGISTIKWNFMRGPTEQLLLGAGKTHLWLTAQNQGVLDEFIAYDCSQ